MTIDTEELRQRAQEAHFGHMPLEISGSEVLELLDRLETAEEERDRYWRAYSDWIAKTEWLQEEIGGRTLPAKYLGMHRADAIKLEIDRLRAKIEAMEKREPVGVMYVGSYYGYELPEWEFDADQCACDKLNEAYVNNPTTLKLYAIPDTKGEEK